MPRYKWENPQEWFREYLMEREPNELYSLCQELAGRLDSDEMQDLFQSDMDADGYFDDLDKPEAEDDETEVKP